MIWERESRAQGWQAYKHTRKQTKTIMEVMSSFFKVLHSTRSTVSVSLEFLQVYWRFSETESQSVGLHPRFTTHSFSVFISLQSQRTVRLQVWNPQRSWTFTLLTNGRLTLLLTQTSFRFLVSVSHYELMSFYKKSTAFTSCHISLSNWFRIS